MKRVFIDSGGFFALLAGEDRFHDHARFPFLRANAERWRLVITNAVVIARRIRCCWYDPGALGGAPLTFLDEGKGEK